mgnify:CR=1 FL=1
MKRNLIVSTILNYINFIFILIIGIISLVENPKSIRMFTVESNLLSGLASIIVAVFSTLILAKKKNEIPLCVKVAKMATTTGVTLTFFTVVFYLGFVAVGEGYSYFTLFKGNNFFFHFLCPVIAIISFIFFEKGKDIKYKLTFFNISHVSCYIVFYITNVLTHLKSDGTVDRKYDWYYFVIGGNWTIGIVAFLMLGITYLLGLLLWFLNRSFIKEKNLFE